MKFHVPDMSCGHCVATIEKAVSAADPAASVTTDLATHEVGITSELSTDALQQVLANAGYPTSPADAGNAG